MEKIKDALRKANSNKQLQTIVSNPRLDSTSSQSDLSEKASEENLNRIQYVNTKTVELNPVHLEKNRIVSYNKNDAATIIFDSLRTQVLQKMEENNWKTIGVVSATPSSGKTFVAINLAISIANQPQKTAMLVDFDLRKPKVSKYLGIENTTSLNDYLEGKLGLGDVLVNPGLPRLVILPTNKPVDKPAETLSSARVNGLISDISERYESRVVIYDLPPLLNTDDTLIMLRKVDCILFVVGNGLVKETEIDEAMHHIPKDKLLGVVLNRAEVSSDTYYY